MDNATAFRRKLTLIGLVVAVCFALFGICLPEANMRSFVWGAAAGLLLISVIAINRKSTPLEPEQVRQNINSNRIWTKRLTFYGVGFGSVAGIALMRFAPAHIIWLAGGFGLGFLALPMFFVAQALLQPSKPKPRDRQFPLEPER